jgi:hypothetical protein
MTEVPAPVTVRVVPETLMTDGVPDEYEKLPGTDPVTVGGVTVKAEFPKFFETLLQAENVGVALATAAVRSLVAEAEPDAFVTVIVTEICAERSEPPNGYVALVAPEILLPPLFHWYDVLVEVPVTPTAVAVSVCP